MPYPRPELLRAGRLVKHLVLTRATRRCRKCSAATVWAVEADLASSRGLCLGHASTPFERGPVPTEREAVHLIVRALGVDRVFEESRHTAPFMLDAATTRRGFRSVVDGQK